MTIVSENGTAAIRPAHSVVIQPTEHFTLTSTGLQVRGKPSYEEWETFGKSLQYAERAVQWWIGDWLNYGTVYGEKYAQALDDTEYAYQTLANYAWVADSIRFSDRSENLSFTHHQAVAAVRHPNGRPDEERQRYYLNIAEQEELSVSQLKQLIRSDERAARLEAQRPVEIRVDEAIVLGDCAEVEWPVGVDLVIADPPYGLSVDGESGVRDGKGDWDEMAYDELHAFNMRWLDKAVNALNPNGSLLVFGTLHNIFSLGHLLKARGLYLVRDIVWVKPFVQRAVNMNQLVPAHELIIWARKGDSHTCNLDSITRDVWEVQPSAPYHHPAEKPEDLITRLITMASHPGDLVADPFLGSGVSAAVARANKRRFWGVEQDEYWHAVATQRAGS